MTKSLFTSDQLDPPDVVPNSTVAEEDKPRIRGNALRCLQMLREGPKTTMQLMTGGAGLRPAARIHELRKAEYVITSEHQGGGEWLHTLVSEQ